MANPKMASIPAKRAGVPKSRATVRAMAAPELAAGEALLLADPLGLLPPDEAAEVEEAAVLEGAAEDDVVVVAALALRLPQVTARH